MAKSYVTVAQKQCLACGKLYDTGEILLDTRLRDTFEMHTTVGYGTCPEDTKPGFICMVGCSNLNVLGKTIKPWEAERTGSVAWIKTEVFEHIFNAPKSKGGVVFCEEQVIERLKQELEVIGDLKRELEGDDKAETPDAQ